MSSRKRSLAEITQPSITPSRRGLTTPGILQRSQSRTNAVPRTARSVRNVNAELRPNSARGILRRLARITAPNTKRRVETPRIALHDKENIAPQDEGSEDEDVLKKPKLNFDIEESIEEDNSEIPVAPTPSALLEDTDEDDEQPTITFQHFEEGNNATQQVKVRLPHIPLLPQSRPAVQEVQAEENDEEGDSTYLTERGRRAISDEPTKMSRYSFGSIRMSDFGSELEVRRESDRQQKLAALDLDDNYGGDMHVEETIQHGGMTDDLESLRPSSPRISAASLADSSRSSIGGGDDGFQMDNRHVGDDVSTTTHMALVSRSPRVANTILAEEVEDDAANWVEESVPLPTAFSCRRQTLLESVTAAAASTHSQKKLRMNSRGNMVPALPSNLIKRIVHNSQENANKRKTTLDKDHMRALEQATEWFFQQVGEDLEAYSNHGRRKKRIDVDDALLLMRRQRVLRDGGDLRRLAKDWLPRDMLHELDLPDRP